ncbi:MAG: hypothetical protein MMC33_010249 [Icmadophila ericetorum]|nr:hypothetical protein [Icmadophila ericetorum]
MNIFKQVALSLFPLSFFGSQPGPTPSHPSQYNASFIGYQSHARAALATLQAWYNPSTGLWETTGWWNSANCLTAMADLAAIDPNVASLAKDIFETTLVQAPQNTLEMVKLMENYLEVSHYSNLYPFLPKTVPRPPPIHPSSFLNEYYDDEGWWALAWIRVYDITHDKKYLSVAATIFEDMLDGYTSPCGGIWWRKSKDYVGAIENELFLSVAAHLANRTPDGTKRAFYLSWALRQWEWFQMTGMINSENLIHNGLDTKVCREKNITQSDNGTVWTYNQGVILGGLLELTRAVGDESMLRAAESIASAAITHLTDVNGILHEFCEPNYCHGDGSQFKGIFLRNLGKLQIVLQRPDFSTFIKKNAQSIWNNDRGVGSNLGLVWSGPFLGADASTQSSALDALVAAAVVISRESLAQGIFR